MKALTRLMAVLAMIGFVNIAMAADDAAPKAEKPNKAAKAEKATAKADKAAKAGKAARKAIKGEVVAVDGNTLKIKTGRRAEQKEVTVTTDASTKVIIEGKPAALADLKPGQRINVLHANEAGTGPALRIAVPAPKAPKGDKAADKAGK